MKGYSAIFVSGSALIVAVLGAWHSLRAPDDHSAVAMGNDGRQARDGAPASEAAPYRSSVVGTDFDFITDADPTAFVSLDFLGLQDFEMPDKRDTGEPLVQQAYLFEARFDDGGSIRLALDADFGSREAAELDAARYGPRLGKLPPLYRSKIRHITVNHGGRDTTAFAEDKGHFFTIYSDNATKRLETNDLEETFFHEGTHASIQQQYLKSPGWRNAVSRDGTFITEYAKTSDQEDFAESALFAYTLILHPERFPEADRTKIERAIPNRIAFFRKIFSSPAQDRGS